MSGLAPGSGLDPGLPETSDLAADHQRQYRTAFYAALAANEVEPVVIPWSFVGSFFLPLLYLSIPHTDRPWLYRLRWAVAAAVVGLNARLIQISSAANEAVGYSVGLMAVWGTIWPLRQLIFTRPQWEAARVERRPRRLREKGMDGRAPAVSTATAPDESVAAALPHYEYFWQFYPADAPWLTRLGWTADLLTAFRGAGWNFAIPSIPHPPPPSSSSQQQRHLHARAAGEPVRLDLIPLSSRTGAPRSQTYSSFLRSRLWNLCLAYLTIDLLTLFIRRDPYFVFGPGYASQLPSEPPHLQQQLPPFLARLPYPALTIPLARNVAACAGVLAGLHLYTALLQLLIVFPLRPLLGARADLWQHPALSGGFRAGVLDRGLPGFWGGWWHQTFRAGFVAPARYLAAVLSRQHHPRPRPRPRRPSSSSLRHCRIVHNPEQASHAPHQSPSQSLSGNHEREEGREDTGIHQPTDDNKRQKGLRASAAGGPTATRMWKRDLLEVCTAFLLSGLLHAAGGHTSAAARLARSRAMSTPASSPSASASASVSASSWLAAAAAAAAAQHWTPVAFFLLQAAGAVLQTLACSILWKKGIFRRAASSSSSSSSSSSRTFPPRWARRAGNLLFVACWLHLTAWCLIDDFGRAGLWLFEPVPFSPLRWMGLGTTGDIVAVPGPSSSSSSSWWRWDEEYGLRWHAGQRWWESGIRL